MESYLSDIIQSMEQVRIDEKKKEIAEMEKITFGKTGSINVLLLTTRLFELSATLKDYLKNSTDINVVVTNTVNDAIEMTENEYFDFFILVGRLKDYRQYHAIENIREITTIIYYAFISDVVLSDCVRFGFEYKFDRTKPMSNLADYMRKIFDCNKRALVEIQKKKRAEQFVEMEKNMQANKLAELKKKRAAFIETAILYILVSLFLLYILLELT